MADLFKKHQDYRVRSAKSVQEVLERFFTRRNKGGESFQIAHLWENWPMVMGDVLKDIALPLGCKEKTLFVGAEDNMAMSELGFQTREILARANAFMNGEYFTKVRVELLQKRKPLSPRPDRAGPLILPVERPRPDNLGGLLRHFDPESKIGKAYKSYVESFI